MLESFCMRLFQMIAKASHTFPPISNRYAVAQKTMMRAFDAVVGAQLASATVTRYFTGQDIRAQITRTPSGQNKIQSGNSQPSQNQET